MQEMPGIIQHENTVADMPYHARSVVAFHSFQAIVRCCATPALCDDFSIKSRHLILEKLFH